MTKDSAAQEIARLLANREETVVLAESCTAGMIASTLGQIPGISQNLCGSFVTYQQEAKRRWLKIKKSEIKTHTAESQPIADQMALAALKRTPKADHAVAVVGHLGPNAPEDKDGMIWVSVARRTKKGNLKVKEQQQYQCSVVAESDNGSQDNSDFLRVRRQGEAVEATLTILARYLYKRAKVDSPAPPKKEKAKTPKKEKHKKEKLQSNGSKE
jgi:nicotinamide-nucleotide amidase